MIQKTATFRTLSLLLGLALGALGGEATLRVLPSRFRDAYRRARYIMERNVLQTEFCEADPDPLLLWRNIPGKTGFFRNEEFNTAVSINSLGMRGPQPSPDDKRPRVLVLGDSITFGWGVEEPDTFVSVLARGLPGRLFLNASVSGYDTESEWGVLKNEGDRLKPKDVLLVFYPNDPLELVFRRPFRRSPPRRTTGWRRSYLAVFLNDLAAGRLFAPEEPYYRGINKEMWARCTDYLMKCAAWCRDRKVVFHVAYVPLKDEIGEPTPLGYRRAMAAFCREQGIDYADITPALQTLPTPTQAYYHLDEHMTPQGHATTAQALKPRIKDR